MDYTQLLQGIEIAAGVDRESAARAARATLVTLADRIGRDQANALRAQLPEQVRDAMLDAPASGEPFSATEFIGRAADREGVPPTRAKQHAKAVLATLRQDAPALEVVRTRLPRDYHDLFDLD